MKDQPSHVPELTASNRTVFPLDPALLPDFPVRYSLGNIRTALEKQGLLILGAATGAGKSTLVPPALMGETWLGTKRIVVLQPQRLGTWAIARRIGALCGLDFGPLLGTLTSRGAQGSPKARLQVMTSGVFLRLLQEDPELSDIGCVVFDEFHQRTWQSDLCLSFCLESRQVLRPDLRILVMSATLDAQALESLMPDAVRMDVPGTLFPVSAEYRPPPAEAGWWKSPAAFHDFMARQVLAETGTKGNILCFLPGMAEIRTLRRKLEEKGLPRDFRIHELHSTTPDDAQAQALSAADSGQIFLASNIAETGLTLGGVRVVIDSGLTRLEFFDPRLGMNSLQTCRVSLDSSMQRQGRAGRTGPGACIKLWSPDEVLDQKRTPDIQRSDLSSFVLESALWGAADIHDLQLVDLPLKSLWNRAIGDLRATGVLQNPLDGPASPDIMPSAEAESFRDYRSIGMIIPGARTLAGLGFHPRLNRAIQKALEQGKAQAAFMIGLSSFLEYRSRHPANHEQPQATQGRIHPTAGADILPALDKLFSHSAGTEVHEQYRKACRRIWGTEGDDMERPPASTAFDTSFLCQQIHPEWTGQLQSRDADRAHYLLAQGRAATLRLGPGQEAPPWLAGLEIETGAQSSNIRLYAPLSENWFREFCASCTMEPRVVWQGLFFKATIRKGLGAIVISETPASVQGKQGSAHIPEDLVRRSFKDYLTNGGLEILPWDDESRQYYLRLGLALKKRLLETRFSLDSNASGSSTPTPDSLFPFDELNGFVLGNLNSWITVQQGEPVLTSRGLCSFLADMLDHRQRTILDSRAPAFFALPGKRPRPIDYSGMTVNQSPAVSVRIQDTFGIASHPMVMGVPLLFHLLSPAGRPVQSTSDLPGFWKGSWQEVRKELKGRYPKHDWPLDPSQ